MENKVKLFQIDRSVCPPVYQERLFEHGIYSKYAMILKASGYTPPVEEYTYTLQTRTSILALVTGTTYYIDSANGDDDTGDGTNGTPWQTIARAQTAVSNTGGDCVVLKGNGNYGVMTDDEYSQSATSPTVWIAEEGSTPIINNVSMIGQDNYNLRLIFYGIKIAPAWVDPGPSAPYNKTASCMYIWGQKYINFYNCEIAGTNKYLTPNLAYLRECSYIYFERCHAHTSGEGFVYLSSDHITFAYNYEHEVCACLFKDGYVGNSYITIEGNHAHNAGFSTLDQYGEDAAFHGSIIAINNSETTIRNNYLHDGGGTSGINFYGDGSPEYHNVLIENNVLYNTTNAVAMVVDLIADGLVIRNNIIFGKKANEDGDAYSYGTAMYFDSLIAGYDGSGVSIYNNIFVGRVSIIADTTYMNIDNNIAYYSVGEDIDTTNSIIAFEDKTTSYFESGFFNGALLLEYGVILDQILNLTSYINSDAIGFGNVVRQTEDSLGSLDDNDEFIIPNGKARSASAHDAGPYQT